MVKNIAKDDPPVPVPRKKNGEHCVIEQDGKKLR